MDANISIIARDRSCARFIGARKPNPVHDWTSHTADAFRYLAMTLYQSDLERIAAAASCARFGRHEKIFRRGESETNLMIMHQQAIV